MELPPLRLRGEDVVLLANSFLGIYNGKNAKQLQGFTQEALDALLRYSWPGNVRELENAIERAVVLSKDLFIDIGVLPKAVVSGRKRFESITLTVGTTLRDAEMELISATLESTGGDKDIAANILGIAARTIYRKLQ